MEKKSSISDFEVLNKLGEGAFGQVFKVKRKADGNIYALKKVNSILLRLNWVPWNKRREIMLWIRLGYWHRIKVIISLGIKRPFLMIVWSFYVLLWNLLKEVISSKKYRLIKRKEPSLQNKKSGKQLYIWLKDWNSFMIEKSCIEI